MNTYSRKSITWVLGTLELGIFLQSRSCASGEPIQYTWPFKTGQHWRRSISRLHGGLGNHGSDGQLHLAEGCIHSNGAFGWGKLDHAFCTWPCFLVPLVASTQKIPGRQALSHNTAGFVLVCFACWLLESKRQLTRQGQPDIHYRSNQSETPTSEMSFLCNLQVAQVMWVFSLFLTQRSVIGGLTKLLATCLRICNVIAAYIIGFPLPLFWNSRCAVSSQCW